MAKASPEEPEMAAEPKPSVGTWPKSEHILHASVMHGQPQWLIEHVLHDAPDDQMLSKDDVNQKVNTFLKHKMEVED